MKKQNPISKIPDNLLSLFSKLNTPALIQNYIGNEITYDPDREDRTVIEVVNDSKAECFNGALFAYACLEYNKFEEIGLIELQPNDDEEHILAVYKTNGRWGAIGQSKFMGLKSREPMYLSIHDLAVSYKEFYFSFDGHYSFKGYSDHFSLEKYNHDWLNKPDVVNQISADLHNSKFTDILGSTKPYIYVSPERYWAEVQFIPEGTVIPERYLQAKTN